MSGFSLVLRLHSGGRPLNAPLLRTVDSPLDSLPASVGERARGLLDGASKLPSREEDVDATLLRHGKASGSAAERALSLVASGRGVSRTRGDASEQPVGPCCAVPDALPAGTAWSLGCFDIGIGGYREALLSGDASTRGLPYSAAANGTADVAERGHDRNRLGGRKLSSSSGLGAEQGAGCSTA